MSRDQENRLKEIEAKSWATLGAEVDEAMLRHLKEVPVWVLEFYVNISECLGKPRAWRNPAPSLEHLDKAREMLSLLGAGHLSSLFDSQNVDGWDKWMMKLVVTILEKMTITHLSREMGLSRDQTVIDLDLMLKIRGFGFVQPDAQAWGRLSPEAKAYLTRVRPSAPRSPRP